MKFRVLIAIFLFTACLFGADTPVLKFQEFELDNGFKVFLNEDPAAKEVYGAVVVKAGSNNDPADATGTAHFLEHMLFKGTTVIGTTDYEKEKVYLDSINIYYDQLALTKDEKKRQKIQRLINNQSVQASKYGLPSELDKLLRSIGSTGINAFTSPEITAYHNSFPVNQLERWLKLYSDRFQNPVFRSFQSESEVIIEEKNRKMEGFMSSLYELVLKSLFKHHPFGTQTTLGSVEHLKNPSIRKMYEFYDNYYVANNMALILSGNFNPETAMPLITKEFSKLRTGKVPDPPEIKETIFNKREVVKVRYTPVRALILGYKTVSETHPDRVAIEVMLSMLFNESGTGTLNKLQADGKILGAGCMNFTQKEEGAAVLFVIPKMFIQFFSTAEKYLLDEIEKIKNGEFSDNDLSIVKNEGYRNIQLMTESSYGRVRGMMSALSMEMTWDEFLNSIDEYKSIGREDIMRVARKYFGENHLALYSRTGFPEKEKVPKSGYKPVVTEQKEESEYAIKFKAEKVAGTSPVFLDFDNDAELSEINESNRLYVTKNEINDIFTLKVEYSVGSESLKYLELVPRILPYVGTDKFNSEDLREEFGMLGLSHWASVEDQRFTITFTGIEANLEKSLQLIDHAVNNCTADKKALNILREEINLERKGMDDDSEFLGMALREYVRFGENSDNLKRISKKELKELNPEDLTDVLKEAVNYNAVWHYAGNEPSESIKELIRTNISLSDSRKETKLKVKENIVSEENVIYLLHDKKAIQSQIYFIVNSEDYYSSPALDAQIKIFNNYIDGSLSGIIFQEVREYRSLAYATAGRFNQPQIQGYPGLFWAYVGTQPDKATEAVEVVNNIITDMPQRAERIDDIKILLKNSASAEYPAFRDISTTIDNYRQRGYNYLPLIAEYAMYDSISFSYIIDFYEKYIKNKPVIIALYGDKSRMDLQKLAEFGKIVELKKSDILKVETS
ncbi:MAG: insulinase family protein, partial [Candidatus Delongbacteria bacterium]|nr:insulinase family protein [Candidatus Delongbacteria bacterium]